MDGIDWQPIAKLPCGQRGEQDYLLWVGDAGGSAVIATWNDRCDRWETDSGEIIADALHDRITYFAEIRAPGT